ncbi:MAG: amidohydrolase family protein [Candidatus Heimdallarchaeota archaeon]|nr:amidohydrolase family protein [Candidatus Heimdallarchaeota archaeon]
MIIDGHAHTFGDFAYSERLIPLMNKLGVDKVVLCPGSADPDYVFELPEASYKETAKIHYFHILANIFYIRQHGKNIDNIDNEFVYSLVKEQPTRLLQYYWINPSNPELITKLEQDYKKMSFNGIKLHQCLNKFSNDDESMKEISLFAEEKNLPIFIHLYNFRESRKFVKLAREHPKTNYTVAHLMGMESIARHGKDLKNVYFDISTYFIISDKRIKYVMKKFGEDKVLFGTDSPLGKDNLENNLYKIKSMELTEKQKGKILGENLSKLLNL